MKRRGALESAIKTGESRYGLLLIVLFVLLLIYPFLGYHKYLTWLFTLTSLGVVASALRASHGRGTAYLVTLLLGFAFVLAELLSRSFAVTAAYPYAVALRVLFFSQMIVMIFVSIMKSKHVSKDTVLGASCIFVMLGLAFGSTFILLEWFVPGAFYIPDLAKTANSNLGQQSLEFDLVYFSLVTMTTLGYGDILPIAPTARALAAFEAMISQLYLAIIIARLVGLEIATRLQNQANE
jgi:voltage-gated potassium channel